MFSFLTVKDTATDVSRLLLREKKKTKLNYLQNIIEKEIQSTVLFTNRKNGKCSHGKGFKQININADDVVNLQKKWTTLYQFKPMKVGKCDLIFRTRNHFVQSVTISSTVGFYQKTVRGSQKNSRQPKRKRCR